MNDQIDSRVPRELRQEVKDTSGTVYHRKTVISIGKLHDGLTAWTTPRSQEGSINNSEDMRVG